MVDYIVIGPLMAVNPGIEIGLKGDRVKDRLFALKEVRKDVYAVQKTFHLKCGEEFSTDHEVSGKMAKPKIDESTEKDRAEILQKVKSFLSDLPKKKDDIVNISKKVFPDLQLSEQDTIAQIKEQMEKHVLRNPKLVKKLNISEK